MKSIRRCTAATCVGVAALAVVAVPREARAAGFANTRIGGEEGSVVATNPTSLYYNPAGIAFASGSQLGLYGSLAMRHATWTRTSTAPSDITDPNAQVGNTGEAHLFNVFGGPSIGGSLKFGNLAIGAGFFAPFYGRAHWAQNPQFNGSQFPLAAGGVQRWFSIDGAMSVLYFTGGVAYKLGPIALGVTVNVISTTLDDTLAKNTGAQGLPNTNAEGRVFIDAHAYNASAAGGLMAEVVRNQLWLAASYQAQPGFGTQTLKGVQVTTNTGGTHTFPSDFTQSLPDIIRAGARWHMKSAPLEFRLFGDLTRWSHYKYTCLYLEGTACIVNADGTDPSGGNVEQYQVRNWRDTYGGRLGVSWYVHPQIEMLFGGGYETGATPDSTLAPDLPDADNFQGTLGARFKLTDSLFLSTEFTWIQYLNRDTRGKNELAVDANGNMLAYPTVQEDAGGIYTAWIGMFTGNLEALF